MFVEVKKKIQLHSFSFVVKHFSAILWEYVASFTPDLKGVKLYYFQRLLRDPGNNIASIAA